MQDPTQPLTHPTTPPQETNWGFDCTHVALLDEDNFRLMLKKRQHSFVMFYSPKCIHCKTAKGEFSGAAEVFKDNLNYLLGAVDCSDKKNARVCKSNQIKRYPTLKYFHDFDKAEATEYTGRRTTADFVAYLRSYGKKETKIEECVVSSSRQLSTKDEDKQSGSMSTWFGGEDSDKVIQLNEGNFDSVVASHSKIMVFFYAPWCGHCNSLKPIYCHVARRLPAEVGFLAACDGVKEVNLTKRFDIQQYPTLKYFSGGHFVANFNGKRTKEGLLEFMKSGGAVSETTRKRD